ncbi:MAG: PAS domain S-box protein [Armatimonadetes bacterium]|nr:PAS domain S-box protein [Anaerolineae bacterium]
MLITPESEADTLSATLALEGYQVVQTSTQADLGQLLVHYHPALVVVDAQLSAVNAIQVCRVIRSLPDGEAYGVMAVIGAKQTAQVSALLAAGMDDCLEPALPARLLRQRVQNLLRLKAYQHQPDTRILAWLSDAAFMCDYYGNITAINPELCMLTGYNAAELIGSASFKVMQIEEADVLEQLRAIPQEQAQAVTLTTRLKRKNQVALPMQLRIKPIEHTGYFLGSLHDLSEQLQAELTLRESEHQYRNLFDSANDSIFIIELATGRFLDVNKRLCRWLGYTQTELLALNFDAIDVPVSHEQQKQLRRELSTNGRLIYEQYYRTKSGTLIPVEVSSRLTRYQGRRAFLCFARDITLRREMEVAERSQRLLAEALSASAAVLNSSLDFNQIVQTMLHLIAGVVSSDAVNISQIEHGEVVVIAQQGYTQPGQAQYWSDLRLKLSEADLLRHMQQTKQAVYVPDTQHQPGWISDDTTAWVRAYAGAPIVVAGEVIGFVNLDSATPNRFSEQHIAALMAFANHAGSALQNARLFESVKLYAEDLERRVNQRTAQVTKANQFLEEQILQRQQIESVLAQERNLLRTLIDNLPDDVYVKDRDGHYLVLNQPLYQRLKRHQPNRDPLGSTDADYMNSANAALYQQEEAELYRTGRVMPNQEILSFDPEGGQRWLLTTKIPLRDAHSELITGIVGINRDITALRGAEEQLSYVVTGANCLLWYAVVERQPSGFVWDLHLSSEAAARRFLPLNPAEDEAYVNAWQRSILPDDAKRRRATSHAAIEAQLEGYHHEYRCLRADGQVRWLYEEVRVRQLLDNRWSLIGICTDITDRKQTAQALQSAYEQLDQRVQERTAELSQANVILKEQIAQRQRMEAERDRIQQMEQQQRLLAQALRDAAADLSRTLDLDDILDRMLTYITQAMPPHESASIMLIEDDGEHVRTLRYYNTNANYTALPRPPMAYMGVVNWRTMFETGQPITLPDTRGHPSWLSTLKSSEVIYSYVGAPIAAEGKVIGFINLGSSQPNTFNADHAQGLQSFANQVGVAIQNARLYAATRTYAEQLEQHVVARTTELEVERTRLRGILDAMTEGIMYHAPDTTPLYINRSLMRLTGYRASELMRRSHVYTLLALTPEEVRMHRQNVYHDLAQHGIFTGKVKIRRVDQTEIDVSLIVTQVNNADGVALGTVTVLRDISQELRLENQKKRFITIASHELRTPVTNLKTRLYLIRRQPENLMQHLDVLDKVTQQMQDLVEDLFDVSRFEHGQIHLTLERWRLQALMMGIVTIQQPEADAKGITLVHDLTATPLYVMIDQRRFNQVLTNLVTNALHYTPAGGSITLSAALVGNQAEITVRDTGVGIPEEWLDQIFKPFFRGGEQSNGAGLGLTITREIIELHGGRIDVESTLDVGTCFYIRLPLLD